MQIAPRTRRVQRYGIYFLGRRYEHGLCKDYAGEDVQIRFNPDDMAEIEVYFEGELLCRAICPALAGKTVTLY